MANITASHSPTITSSVNSVAETRIKVRMGRIGDFEIELFLRAIERMLWATRGQQPWQRKPWRELPPRHRLAEYKFMYQFVPRLLPFIFRLPPPLDERLCSIVLAFEHFILWAANEDIAKDPVMEGTRIGERLYFYAYGMGEDITDEYLPLVLTGLWDVAEDLERENCFWGRDMHHINIFFSAMRHSIDWWKDYTLNQRKLQILNEWDSPVMTDERLPSLASIQAAPMLNGF